MSWLNLNDQQAFGLSANDVFYVSALLFLALKRDRLLPMSLPRPVSWSARARATTPRCDSVSCVAASPKLRHESLRFVDDRLPRAAVRRLQQTRIEPSSKPLVSAGARGTCGTGQAVPSLLE